MPRTDGHLGSLARLGRTTEGWPLLRPGEVLPTFQRHLLLLHCLVLGFQELDCHLNSPLAELVVDFQWFVTCCSTQGLLLVTWLSPILDLLSWCLVASIPMPRPDVSTDITSCSIQVSHTGRIARTFFGLLTLSSHCCSPHMEHRR